MNSLARQGGERPREIERQLKKKIGIAEETSPGRRTRHKDVATRENLDGSRSMFRA
jgi:hypothetical protein